ncbi:hypothetical protein F5884DRAFT_789737 [Xylogone sp. PMI_703]|nr:hypothetical protein F5884DRAFT_789737 [Xylogone sp. PMI_703]
MPLIRASRAATSFTARGSPLMRSVAFLSALVFVWRPLIHPVYAQCSLAGDQELLVQSQEDLDQLGPNCTEFEGTILVAPDYTGSLVLNGITDLGGLKAESSESSNPHLTSISMPAMISVDQILFQDASALTNVSIPNATRVGSITIAGVPGTTFYFKSVTEANDVSLSGKISGLYFNSLVSIVGGLEVTATSESELILDCPALQNASNIALWGNFNSLVLPQLQSIGGGCENSEIFYPDLQIQVDNGNKSFDILLPSLSHACIAQFKGSIESIYLPSLLEVDDITISASLPLNVSMTHLQNASQIELTGNITGAEFPALQDVKSIIIASDLPLNCTPALTAYELYGAKKNGSSYGCNFPPPKSQSNDNLSLGAKLGLGIGIGGGALVIALIWSISKLYRKDKKNKELKTAIKLQQLNSDGEALPDYQTATGTSMRRRATLQDDETSIHATGERQDGGHVEGNP